MRHNDSECPRKCNAKKCNNLIPDGRWKYCSAECQISSARQLTRKWSESRSEACEKEIVDDIPAQIRRYKIKGGSEIYAYLKDSTLISNRNPQGSTYVEEIIEWVDTLWPGESAMENTDPCHGVFIAAPSRKGTSILPFMAESFEISGVDTRLLYSRKVDEIFKVVQDWRPTIVVLHQQKEILTIIDRIEQFRNDGMLVLCTYRTVRPLVRVSRCVDGFFYFDPSIKRDKWHDYTDNTLEYLLDIWDKVAEEKNWLS